MSVFILHVLCEVSFRFIRAWNKIHLPCRGSLASLVISKLFARMPKLPRLQSEVELLRKAASASSVPPRAASPSERGWWEEGPLQLRGRQLLESRLGDLVLESPRVRVGGPFSFLLPSTLQPVTANWWRSPSIPPPPPRFWET